MSDHPNLIEEQIKQIEEGAEGYRVTLISPARQIYVPKSMPQSPHQDIVVRWLAEKEKANG